MEGISKSFGPVKALTQVDLEVCSGRLHALCGENGAGKSTLMKVLAGVHAPDSGSLELQGKPVSFDSPGEALEAGVAMIYQELDLAEDLTVSENMFLGCELTTCGGLRLDKPAMLQATRELCKECGFDLHPEAKISDLSPGECQLVELLKALHRDARILVFDEPTSSLSEREAEALFRIIRDLKSRGYALVYISHRLEEVMDMADDISVLRDGKVVFRDQAENLDIPTVVNYMVGRELTDFYPSREPDVGDVLFQAEGICSPEGIQDISFEVRKGEIVGMAGLVGAGRSETARAIFGITSQETGLCTLNGEPLPAGDPSASIQRGMAYVTEDRKRTGLCAPLPCSWNITLPHYQRMGMGLKLDKARERITCADLGKQVNIKWSEPDAPASSLSGGNQQKVLIARWLLGDADFLMFDEPTRGIDVGAKREIYQLMYDLAAQGKGLLVISSELPELFGICDRILVLRDGHLVANKVTSETTPEEILHLAALETA
jgi:ABC-type sugar transport system ATPase subunit